jgi:HEAT repeat protein
MDPNLSASEKLAALDQLRDNGAQTPEVISHMLDFYLSNQDPGTRAEILSQFDGVTDPILKIPLLDGLANDPNARVREEAADSLSGYLDDPKVVEWLQFAASNDPDSRVREEAADVLEDAGLF